MIFPKYYTDQLSEIFLKKENGKQSATMDMDVDGETLEDVEGEELEDVDGEPVDLDGEPLDEDLDGEPLDGEPLDGEPLDGSPINDDDIQQQKEVENLYTPVNDMFSLN
ncbi:MAG: hypothetical protein JSY10_17985 [Paenibacillus sp.]|nr:hypothetical protein [Paenibacillus sp.]